MSETTDRAALIAEAAEYEGYCYFCGDLMPNLAAALAASERELAHLRGVIAAAVKHARKTRELNRTLLDNLNGFASGADFQARDTLVILSNA